MRAKSLRPTQAEFSPAKVKQAAEYEGGERSILVSLDNYVVDGHHQWLAKKGGDIQIIRIKSPIKDLLKTVAEFPSAEVSTETAEPKSKEGKLREQWEIPKAKWVDGQDRTPAKHRAIIKKAIDDGDVVPAEVLNSYPTLKKYAAETAADRALPPRELASKKRAERLAELAEIDVVDRTPAELAESMRLHGYDQVEAAGFDTTTMTEPEVIAKASEIYTQKFKNKDDAATTKQNSLAEEYDGKTLQEHANDGYRAELAAAGVDATGMNQEQLEDAMDKLHGTDTRSAEQPAEKPKPEPAPNVAPRAKKPKEPPMIDRLENFFVPGRVVDGYGGKDKVLSFDRDDGTGRWMVEVQGIQRDGSYDDRVRRHSTLPSNRELAEWEKTNPVPAREVAKKPTPVKPETKASETKKSSYGSTNKVFTESAAEEARRVLKEKLSNLNSGIDPETLRAGIMLAGYHIEAGARSFSAYSKAMIDDLGQGIKPFLRSFYESVRYYPGFDNAGMDSSTDIDSLDLPVAKPQEIGVFVDTVKRRPAKGKQRIKTLTDDWGVEAIDEYSDAGEVAKEKFLTETLGYLRDVKKSLESNGFGPHSEKSKPVSKNEGGVAGSGSVSLSMFNPDTGMHVHASIESMSLRGVVPTNKQGVAILYRASPAQKDQFATKGVNRWAPMNSTASDLAGLILAAAEQESKSVDASKKRADNASVPAKEAPQTDLFSADPEVQDDIPVDDQGDDQGAGSESLPANAGDGRTSDESASVQPESGSGEQQLGANGSREGGKRRSSPARDDSKNGAVRKGRAGNRSEPDTRGIELSLRSNYRITDRDNLGQGGAVAKARGNIQAIRILKSLKSERREPTQAELQALVKYVGWGASDLANKLFPSKGEPEGTWKELRDELKGLLTEQEYETAARSTQYAHYTSKSVIDSIWSAVERMGLKNGMVFEGGMGTGNFTGLIPPNMNLHYSGVEMDVITAGIAKVLYPDSGVINADFTKLGLPENYYDLTIGNPPFAGITILGDPKYRRHKFKLHDYFIAKQIDALKPGGLAVFVTSKGTMDKAGQDARQYLSERVDLLGAIRLPQTAFKENAGTEVVTDILFFQKREEGADAAGPSWLGLKEISTPEGPAYINEYFASHPGMILGQSSLQSSRYGPAEYTVLPTGDIQEQLAAAVQSLPQNVYAKQASAQEIADKAREFELSPGKTEGSYYFDDAKVLRQVTGGVGEIVPIRSATQKSGLSAPALKVISAYIPLRDAVLKVYASQQDTAALSQAQADLHIEYDKFVKANGPINRIKTVVRSNGLEITSEPVLDVVYMDPYAYQVAMIEKYDEATGEATKHNIFFEQIRTQDTTRSIESAVDALSVTLNDKGYVDMDYLAEIYKTTPEAALAELDTAVYQDPATGKFVTEDDYLSGNVKAKLAVAREQSETDGQYQRNVKALEAVLPEDLPIARIPVNLGAMWVPREIVQKFAEETLDFKGSISSFIQGDTSNWQVTGTSENQAYATGRRKAVEILSAALNRSTVKVYDTYYDGTTQKQELNKEETAAANQKVQEIRDKFQSWVLSDADASELVHDVYNARFNTTVPRKYNGSHLTLPRLSSRYTPHSWQKNGVWRIITSGNTYLAHTVGSGKTLTSTIAAMELKRLGLAKKPAFSVLKSTLKQFAMEFLDAYPDAKVLIADERQLDRRNLKRFYARLTAENWDAVVLSHQAFEKIALSNDYVAEVIESELSDYRSLLESVDESDRAARKQVERQIEAMEQRLDAMTSQDRKITGIPFEETGIDFVFVDEAHHHKKIPFPTNQSNIKGVDPTGSNIAYDMYLKSRYLNSVRPHRALVLMSGTPVTNTVGEVFNIQRYLQPEVLESGNVSSFDTWSATFTTTVTELEMQPSGAFKPSTRLAKFVGVPALMRDFLQIADVVTDAHLNESVSIKRPAVRGGQRQIVTVPRSPELQAYQATLAERIKKLEDKKGPPKKGEDNILVVIGDAKKASIDLRLAGLPQNTPSKLDFMIEDVFKSWSDTKDFAYKSGGKTEPLKGATQLIFTEIRTSMGFDIYDHIKSTLVRKGVPAEQIAFIQDYDTTKKKKKLFREMNTGAKRILLGGSKNLGTGTNVQQRLYDINHLDIDYLPANIVQREGRGIRQGNKNPDVGLRAYATSGTVDAFMWQLNETKQRMIDQVMSGNLSIDEVEDISDNASQMAQAKALASGNPLLLEQAGLTAEVTKLRALRDAHKNQTFNNRRKAKALWAEIAKLRDAYTVATAVSADYQNTSGENFKISVFGKTFTDRKKAGDYIQAAIGSAPGGKVGSLAGFDLSVQRQRFDKNPELTFLDGKSIWVEGQGIIFDPAITIRLDDQTDSVGLIKRLENTARKISELPVQIDAAIQGADRRRIIAEEQSTTTFQYDDDLKLKEERLAEITSELSSVVSESKPAALTQVDSIAFREWFKSSKVVDANGEPLVVYHATSERFSAFDKARRGSNTGWANANLGFFFIADRSLAEQFAKDTSGGDIVVEAYLSIQKPIRLTVPEIFNDADQAVTIHEILSGDRVDPAEALEFLNESVDLGDVSEFLEAMATDEAKAIMERDGYDGVISHFGDGNLEYVAFEPEQIKSVDNRGTFDPKNPDIRYSVQAQPPSKELRKWFGDSKIVDENGDPLVVYHGTDWRFDEFRPSPGLFGTGIYVTPERSDAEQYTSEGQVLELYVRINRPFVTEADYSPGEDLDLDSPAVPLIREVFGKDADSLIERLRNGDETVARDIRSELQEMGHDGIEVRWPDGLKHYVAFESSQIKSAIGNRGTFDPNDPRIQYSTQAGVADGLSALELDKSLRSTPLGRAIGAAIDSGNVKLHDNASQMPGQVAGAQAVTMPDGTIHLAADKLTADTALPVLMHEAFHSGAQSFLGAPAWRTLNTRLSSLHRQGRRAGGAMKQFWMDSRARVENAKAAGVTMTTEQEIEDFAAYAIEEYESAPLTLRKWVNDLIGAVKAWLLKRFGKQVGEVTPAQLRSIAASALKVQSPGMSAAPAMSVSPSTKSEYEQRIDELFAGGKASADGVRMLDSSDVMVMMGFKDLPVHVSEGKVKSGQFNHRLTAEHWKKIPQWLENPVAVFESQSDPDRLVFFAPEALPDGSPISIVVATDSEIGRTKVHLTITAYERTPGTPVHRWAEEGLLRYLNQKESPAFNTTTGLRLPRVVHQMRGQKNKVYTERDLVKHRAGSGLRFSVKPTELAKDIANSIKEARTPTMLDRAGWKLQDYRAAGLYFLARNQLVDIGSKVLPTMNLYQAQAKRMDAYRNHLLSERSVPADEWRKYAEANKQEAQALADLMHDATIAGVDPAAGYTPITDAATVKANIKKFRQQARDRSGEGTARWIDLIKREKNKLLQESNRVQASDGLYARWNRLSPEAKSIYITVRDAYSEHQAEVLKALEQRIEENIASLKHRRALIDALRAQFETSKVQAPYFPLSRFGEYWARVQELDSDAYSFHMFETKGEQTQFLRSLEEDPTVKVSHGKKLENFKDMSSVSAGFVAEVHMLLDQAGSGPTVQKIKDEIYQMYLTSLPDLSVRKHFIHRGKVKGYSQDAIRSFSHFMFHGSYQLARMKYAHRLENLLEEMRSDIGVAGNERATSELAARATSGETGVVQRLHNIKAIESAPDAATDFLNELQKRHEWAMNPKGSATAQFLTSFGFMFYLGISPAAAIVNLTQTPMVALPVMGARWGYAKSAKELTRAVNDFFRGRQEGGSFTVSNVLNGEELAAFRALEESGILDKTLGHDLAGMSEQGFKYNSTAHRVMNVVSYFFHHAERFNREITALATYRLARSAGASALKATQAAGDVTETSHFDYSSSNKARLMHSDTARVLLLFRQFSLNMTYLLARTAHQSLKAGTVAAKKEARMRLAGILGMSFTFAGVMGMPMFWVVKFVLETMFDDEDEPFVFDAEFRKFLVDLTGSQTAGAIIARGPVDVATGASISTRVGLNNLWIREDTRDLEGQAAYQYWLEQVAGPIGGTASGAFRWLQLMDEGQYGRAFEALLPVFMKNALKAHRFNEEGANSMRGDALIEDVPPKEVVLQLLGFMPTALSERYNENSAVKRVESRILDRRSKLLDRYALTSRLGDKEAVQETLEEIGKFNRANPEVGIRNETIIQSLRSRRNYSNRANNGIILNPDLMYLGEKYDFAK